MHKKTKICTCCRVSKDKIYLCHSTEVAWVWWNSLEIMKSWNFLKTLFKGLISRSTKHTMHIKGLTFATVVKLKLKYTYITVQGGLMQISLVQIDFSKLWFPKNLANAFFKLFISLLQFSYLVNVIFGLLISLLRFFGPKCRANP